ncbi:hypothetical protein DSM106972_010630 [Dulcicalothrix desertica PCC 7102]|uniref:DUF4058 domain-containing protein n=1 Tax=Dulcicalothrix desertica PCC 7102 TaxID=232991 RepID=A0A3S1J773_9CYAN|nr:DUF4058 family protein [Dulcicalothrix desertica]RUT09010.1 hypothetical protein DSM106972_010630 [Dulcicalothrix desertica PCC 7102]TWH49894.1 uncharacterized protein DUF4058 [Dulcicalothrix desertica PCC 7102]
MEISCGTGILARLIFSYIIYRAGEDAYPTRDSIKLSSQSSNIATTPAPLTLPVIQPIQVRIPNIEIRDVASNTLVSCIEILSPVNKREPNLSEYRKKRQRLYNANVHLIEIDLLRRGTRPFNHPRIPDVSYLITLTRAASGVIELWPLKLQDTLPIIPIPLKEPDPDAVLDLQNALNKIYDEAGYDLSIDYHQLPPPPALSQADKDWIEARLTNY